MPFAVGLVYIAMGYFSWTLGSILLNHADRRLDRTFNIVALPLVSTFIMCQFDLVIDPSTVTVMLFTMLYSAVLAFVHLYKDKTIAID